MSRVWFASALAALAPVLVVGAIASGRSGTTDQLGGLVTRSSPGRVVGILRWIGRSRLGRRVRRDRLIGLQASADPGWTTDEWVGTKLVLGSACLVGATALSVPVAGFALGILAWRTPEIVLGRQARRRVARASSEVPLFLDLLSVASAAGLAPQLAVRLAAEPLRGPLAADLGRALQRAELGRRWRDELGAVADRLGLAELRRAVAVLGRSEAIGSALADEMSRLAVDVRETRRARATERARTAPVKMLFPLVFLILPAFLLLTVVPVLLSTVRSIG